MLRNEKKNAFLKNFELATRPCRSEESTGDIRIFKKKKELQI